MKPNDYNRLAAEAVELGKSHDEWLKQAEYDIETAVMVVKKNRLKKTITEIIKFLKFVRQPHKEDKWSFISNHYCPVKIEPSEGKVLCASGACRGC